MDTRGGALFLMTSSRVQSPQSRGSRPGAVYSLRSLLLFFGCDCTLRCLRASVRVTSCEGRVAVSGRSLSVFSFCGSVHPGRIPSLQSGLAVFRFGISVVFLLLLLSSSLISRWSDQAAGVSAAGAFLVMLLLVVFWS